jgi:hypothetical protein
MSTKTNVAAVIAIAMGVAAPAAAFAQQAIFYPPSATAHASPPPGTIVTDPYGRVIGADPDAGVRLQLRRDWDRNR